MAILASNECDAPGGILPDIAGCLLHRPLPFAVSTRRAKEVCR